MGYGARWAMSLHKGEEENEKEEWEERVTAHKVWSYLKTKTLIYLIILFIYLF